MTKLRKIRIIKNIFLYCIVVMILFSLMMFYYDYSAQLPLYIGGGFVAFQYIFFCIFYRFVDVKIDSEEEIFWDEKKGVVNILIDKKILYPYKYIEIKLLYKNKYDLTEKSEKIRCKFELNDRTIERKNIELKKLKYGYTKVSLEEIYVYDMFGFGRRRICKKNAAVNILVLPQEKSIQIEMPKIPYVSGDETEVFYEDRDKDGSESFEIREFADGDSIKKIHWKLSLKTELLIVRENVRDVQTNIYVFVDLDGNGDCSHNIEEALSITFELLRNGYALYLAWYDKIDNRMKRKLIIDEGRVYEAFIEVMRYEAYYKDETVMEKLEKFMKDGKEIYNLFVMQ